MACFRSPPMTVRGSWSSICRNTISLGPGNLPQMRAAVCWRVGADGILIHGNHYHPICLRPGVCAPAAIDHRSDRQPIHRSLVARNGQDPSCPGCKHRRAVAGGWLRCPSNWSTEAGALPIADVAFWLCGDTGAGCEGVLPVAAALRLCDIRRRMGACRGCRFRRCRCHRRSGGAVSEEQQAESRGAYDLRTGYVACQPFGRPGDGAE